VSRHVDTPHYETAAEPEGASCDRSWDDLVVEGRSLAEQIGYSRWRLGDLALEVEEMRPHGGFPAGVEARLRVYAAEIGVSFDSLEMNRWVSSRWSAETRRLDSKDGRPAASWSVHQSLAGHEDRANLIRARDTWTVSEAREISRSRRAAKRERERVEAGGDPDEDRVFTDIELEDLLPPDGRCPLTGVAHEQWARLERAAAAA